MVSFGFHLSRNLLSLAAVLMGGLLLFNSGTEISRAQTPGADEPIPPPSIEEISVDQNLASVLGLTLRKASVRYPASMKLTVLVRVWRDGQLDKKVSARREHGVANNSGQSSLMLGWLDGDQLTPEPHGKVKYFGTGGSGWIDSRPAGSSIWGGSIDLQNQGPLPVGEDVFLMELIYGDMPNGYKGLTSARPPAIRITIHVRVDPLSEGDQRQLLRQPNFNRAFAIEE